MSYRFSLSIIAALSLLTACAYRPPLPDRGAYLVDSGGRSVATLDVGGSLEVGAQGLAPGQAYEFELALDGERVSYARLTATSRGQIAPFHLWYQSGVVGCSLRERDPGRLPRFMFRDFDEAQRALEGRTLSMTVRPVRRPSGDAAPSGREAAAGTQTVLVGDQEARAALGTPLSIPVRARRSPMVFPSTHAGCLLNSAEAATQDMFVSGRHFTPGETVEVRVVPNQRLWRVGDVAGDVTGVSGAGAGKLVRVGADGRFTARVWEKELQRRGAYDIVVRRGVDGPSVARPWIEADDVISYGSDTAYLLFLRYPPGGPLMDVAGRSLSGYPYFEFADSFAETGDDVWAAVDPTYVPATHPGGRYAAYYVVPHRSVAQWGSNTALSNPDASGSVEIMPVKAGCINGTDVVVWSGTKPVGDYDVVVNFGSTPAETASAFTDDFIYDATLDFLDGADQIGFRVAKDPYELSTIPIGEAEYSFDNFIPTLGRAANVDLRAVVRYPATSAGTNVPVRAGQHPVFVIEHGNHLTCNITRAGLNPYTTSWSLSDLYNYDDCPNRKANHKGYMRLLETLASHGIIAVSIDAYDLTSCTQSGCRPQWIEERGDLILRHLEFWSQLGSPGTYPTYTDPFASRFQGHVDMSKISVSGHSRGGEASVAAQVRNLSRPAAQRFSINSVSSIAPVDGLAYTLGDVPYFVILPAADCDVSDLGGARIYDRAGGATDQTVKSGNHVYGANHNFFNTVWAADGDDCGSPARVDFIPAADQQRLGEAYLAAFTRAQLLNQDVYEDMLRSRLTFPSTSGRKIHHLRHEKNHRKVDAGAGAGTAAAGTTAVSVSSPSVHATQALRLNWSGPNARYTYTFSPGLDTSGYEVLAFRAAQTGSAVNPASGQEFSVRLVGGGKERAVYTGRFNAIPAPYDRPGFDNNVMTTVRIPLHSFIMNNSGVTLNSIDTVEFLFSNPSQGEIYLDDVEFSR